MLAILVEPVSRPVCLCHEIILVVDLLTVALCSSYPLFFVCYYVVFAFVAALCFRRLFL